MTGQQAASDDGATVLDWSIEPRDVGAKGIVVECSASEAERRAVVAALDLIACRALGFKGRARPRGKDRFELVGTIEADLDQACVVSLQPVSARLTIEVLVQFEAAAAAAAPSPSRTETTIDVDPLAPDLVEPLDSAGRIDVGRIVYEELAAALDPFPRRADAAFDWKDPAAPAPEALSPFAKLARLKEPKS